MATPALSYQNKFSTTLSSGITASDTTIPLTALPTPSEGYILLEPDSTAWEEVYYTSKTGSAIICPSVAAGRGVGGSTAASHAQGATVRMDSSAEMFATLQDATALTGVHQMNIDNLFDHVVSGCVWSGDAYASTLLASMTSGVVYINGRRHTVASVTSRAFTASKDTYVDLLYSTTNNIATPVYTEVNNNAASPALASNSVRLGIVVSGATNIAAATSVNQGQETMVLPIASSIPYAVTDSLGNLICPRDPNRKVLGYRQIIADFTTSSATVVQVTGLSVPVIVPTGRKIKITANLGYVSTAGLTTVGISVWDGTVGSGTQLAQLRPTSTAGAAFTGGQAIGFATPAAASKTYNVGILSTAANSITVLGTTMFQSVLVELV